MFRLLDWSVEELFLNLTCSFQHMIVAGVEAVGQSKLAEERISDDRDDRFALRVTDIFHHPSKQARLRTTGPTPKIFELHEDHIPVHLQLIPMIYKSTIPVIC